jgi:hypothetical protein
VTICCPANPSKRSGTYSVLVHLLTSFFYATINSLATNRENYSFPSLQSVLLSSQLQTLFFTSYFVELYCLIGSHRFVSSLRSAPVPGTVSPSVHRRPHNDAVFPHLVQSFLPPLHPKATQNSSRHANPLQPPPHTYHYPSSISLSVTCTVPSLLSLITLLRAY